LKPVAGLRGKERPHVLQDANKAGERFCTGVVIAASGMILFIGLVARYDIGGSLRSQQMSGARPIKKITPDATFSNQAGV
jgi:hypothetical protein